ncbi:hypothetical protein Tco_1268089 [Tanacetum coccineum]
MSDFKSRHKASERQDRFTPLTKTPKEILTMETLKFRAPPPMHGPPKNINKNKFCEFHGDKGHSTDESIHMKKQIEEAVKSGQSSHLIIELKKGGNKGEPVKASKNGETSKEKDATIFMVQPWQRRRTRKSNGDRGEEEHSASALMNFLVVRSPLPYSGIIGRLSLRKIQAVPSTAHGMLKFPVEGGIVTLRSNTVRPAECKMVVGALSEPSPNEPTTTE